jgi:hypothetical protein
MRLYDTTTLSNALITGLPSTISAAGQPNCICNLLYHWRVSFACSLHLKRNCSYQLASVAYHRIGFNMEWSFWKPYCFWA